MQRELEYEAYFSYFECTGAGGKGDRADTLSKYFYFLLNYVKY